MPLFFVSFYVFVGNNPLVHFTHQCTFVRRCTVLSINLCILRSNGARPCFFFHTASLFLLSVRSPLLKHCAIDESMRLILFPAPFPLFLPHASAHGRAYFSGPAVWTLLSVVLAVRFHQPCSMSAILIADVLVAALLQVLLDHFMQGKRLPRK